MKRQRTACPISQVDAEVSGGLVALSWIFLQCSENDVFQVGADLRVYFARRHWRLFKDRRD